MGVMFVYQTAGVTTNAWSVLPYLSISLSLNVLVTLVIIIRLILHAGNTRTALGGAGIGGLCKAIVVMLVESCALYAVSSLLFIGPLGAGSFIMNVFLPILAETQVRAFPLPRSSDRLSNVAMCWAGHRFTAHHQTGRQQERVDKQHSRFRTYQLVQSWESMGGDWG